MEAVTNELCAYSTQGRKELQGARCCVIMQRMAFSKGRFRFFLVDCPACFRLIPLALSRALFCRHPASWERPPGKCRGGSWRPNGPHRIRVTGLPTFVPDSVRSDVLQWGHSSFLSSPAILVSLGPYTLFGNVFGGLPSSRYQCFHLSVSHMCLGEVLPSASFESLLK